MKNVADIVSERLEYSNLSDKEKINVIKNKFNLTHGKGRTKKKGKKK